MKFTSSKSKNSESFYITQSYVKDNGKSSSKVYKKLGTLKELCEKLNTDRDGVIAWGHEQVRIETERYKSERQTVMIPFNPNKQIEKGKQVFYKGGYLFLQSIYYALRIDRICRKIRDKNNFEYDINAILSDLIYARILEPSSKRSSYTVAKKFLEPPTYEMHDIYRALSVLSDNCDLIQSEIYKNSNYITSRNDRVLFYDCTNYYFEIEHEDGNKKHGKSKEHRPNPIIQMGMFVDGDGIPLAFSLFPGNQNEQLSLKPLEQKVLNDFGHDKFIYCSDAGLGSQSNRKFNHIGQRSFIVTQSIKKLKKEDQDLALSKEGFRRVSDEKPVSPSELANAQDNGLFYKIIPYISGDIEQLLIVTYSPKYAKYQKSIREKQAERAALMISTGTIKKQRQNPNDPARFVNKIAATKDGEVADIHYYLDKEKIAEEEKYDGLYAVCTDLLDDSVADILKVSEGRWQIEECFRIMKTDFEARPVFVQREDRIQAHFLICFLALLIFRLLEKKLDNKYTCCEILSKLKEMNFAKVQDQGFMPTYTRDELSDKLHEICRFRTDYEIIVKSKMKEIQKKSKGR